MSRWMRAFSSGTDVPTQIPYPITTSTSRKTDTCQLSSLPFGFFFRLPYRIAIRRLDTPLYRDLALALPGQAHISAATRQFLRYLDRRDAPAVPAGSTGFDNRP